MRAEPLGDFTAALSGFAGQASGTGFMAGICSSTVNLLSVKWRKAAFLLSDRSQYGATGTNLSYEVFTAG